VGYTRSASKFIALFSLPLTSLWGGKYLRPRELVHDIKRSLRWEKNLFIEEERRGLLGESVRDCYEISREDI